MQASNSFIPEIVYIIFQNLGYQKLPPSTYNLAPGNVITTLLQPRQ